MPAGTGDAPWLIAAYKVLALNSVLLQVCDNTDSSTLRGGITLAREELTDGSLSHQKAFISD